MASNTRAENQYYGKFRECCVVAQLNHAPIEYNENYEIPADQRLTIFNQAKIVADFIGNHTATYIGNHTGNESGDILLNNGQRIELKSVSAGTGTYHNTTMNYLKKFNFNFKECMDRHGWQAQLKEICGDLIPINFKTFSPVSQKNSSFLRHNYEELFKEKIIPAEEIFRMEFVKELADYFTNNPEQRYIFVSDMLNKESQAHKKTSPDRLIVWNYQKNTVNEIDVKNFKNNINTDIRATKKGLVIGNMRFALSWGNGVGLSNPVIRVSFTND